MTIRIQSVQFTPSETLDAKIQQKLKRAFDKYPYLTTCTVFLRLENDNASQQTVEIRINALHDEFFAKETKERFEFALPDVINKLKRQLEKCKQKLYTNP